MSTDSATFGPRYTTRLLLLLIIGIGISAWLLYHHVTVQTGNLTAPSLCNISATFNCDQVAQSRYSEFLSIPVASWGIWYYFGLVLLILIFAPLPTDPKEQKSRFADLMLFGTSLSLLPTIALFFLSWFSVGSLCLFCSALYLINILSFFVVLLSKEREPGVLRGFIDGLTGTLVLLTTGKLGPTTYSSLRQFGYWAMLLAAAGILVRVPDLLVAHVFEPRKASLVDRINVAPAVERWQSAKKRDMKLIEEGTALQRDIYRGPADAVLTIVEYVDFQCPACRRAASALKPLVEEFPGKVRVVFRNFPLDSSCNRVMEAAHHAYACIAATMARCAAAQGATSFWKMHDALFGLSFWNDESVYDLPKTLGLDTAEMDSCLAEGEALERVKMDIENGIELKLVSTPTVFLNGRALQHGDLAYLPGMLKMILEEKRY